MELLHQLCNAVHISMQFANENFAFDACFRYLSSYTEIQELYDCHGEQVFAATEIQYPIFRRLVS